jgi:uncharacterized membrane protein
MKQNLFYLIAGIVGLAEVGVFWLSVDMRNPFLIMGAFIVGIIFLYALWRMVSDRKDDERSIFISEKAKSKTLEVFWVVFFAVSLGSVVIGFSEHLRIPPPNPPLPGNFPFGPEFHPDRPFIGYFGLFQMVLLFLLIFLYIGFRIYYARKYGEWDKDEE